MRAAAFLAALSLAGHTGSARPVWLNAQLRLFTLGVGDSKASIVRTRLNFPEYGKLLDRVWFRGDFSCNLCGPLHHKRAVVTYDVRKRVIVDFHLYD